MVAFTAAVVEVVTADGAAAASGDVPFEEAEAEVVVV